MKTDESFLVLFCKKERSRAGLAGRPRASKTALLFVKRSKNFHPLG
jgi:hypothetical protein